MKFQGIFSDKSWRRFRPQITAPHDVWVQQHSADGTIAVLVVQRTRAEGDWALSKKALDYMTDGERDKRIAQGHVALFDHKWIEVGNARACDVLARVGNTPLNAGRWGDFWWLDSTL